MDNAIEIVAFMSTVRYNALMMGIFHQVQLVVGFVVWLAPGQEYEDAGNPCLLSPEKGGRRCEREVIGHLVVSSAGMRLKLLDKVVQGQGSIGSSKTVFSADKVVSPVKGWHMPTKADPAVLQSRTEALDLEDQVVIVVALI